MEDEGMPTYREQRLYSEELAFMLAMDKYKRDNDRPYPSWSEALFVLKEMGYTKG